MAHEFEASAISDELRAVLGEAAIPGWSLDEVSVARHSMGEVVVAHYRGVGGHLAFIVAPRVENEPAFRRGRRLQLVYFSDDLSKRDHDQLYGRDRDAIEAFARWFCSWEASRETAPE